MSQDDATISQECAQDLDSFLIFEMVETAAQYLPVKGHESSSAIVLSQIGAVLSEALLDLCGGCASNDGTDCGVGGRSFPVQVEYLVECLVMGTDERVYLSVRGRSAQNGEYRKE